MTRKEINYSWADKRGLQVLQAGQIFAARGLTVLKPTVSTAAGLSRSRPSTEGQVVAADTRTALFCVRSS